jgi:hypothetical protein
MIAWHNAMAILLFKIDQPFMLHVLFVLAQFTGALNKPRSLDAPNEPDSFQNFLLISSKVVFVMDAPLVADPLPKRLVLLTSAWHHAMAILSLEVSQLFTFLVPELVVWFVVVSAFTFPSEPDFIQSSLPILQHQIICMNAPPCNGHWFVQAREAVCSAFSTSHHVLSWLPKGTFQAKKTKVGGCGIAKKTEHAVDNVNSRVRWQTTKRK